MTHKVPVLLKRSPKTNDVRPHSHWPDVLVVQLQNRQACQISKARYEALQAAGHTGRWFANRDGKCGHSYVRLEGPSNLLTVARLITDCEPGQAVRYLNGNRFDLRDENLSVVAKRGGKCKNPVQEAEDRFPGDVEAQAAWLRRRARKGDRTDLAVIATALHGDTPAARVGLMELFGGKRTLGELGCVTVWATEPA
ncbi:hypothetical protein [Methylibium rhizosphaerae]|uniref:hypothetical protein n=1 Tax=Methylibium rhizosphaerae TaxID=2570323 RepID=UPI0011298258|nr:hypothetical protein [Methylibium rhizosphaerae]